jgi:hypothetical protein
MALFQERETRDELGLGSIRDSIADHLFPGTSTIQTRLRYMLFIPWLFQMLEGSAAGSDQLATEARALENRLACRDPSCVQHQRSRARRWRRQCRARPCAFWSASLRPYAGSIACWSVGIGFGEVGAATGLRICKKAPQWQVSDSQIRSMEKQDAGRRQICRGERC